MDIAKIRKKARKTKKVAKRSKKETEKTKEPGTKAAEDPAPVTAAESSEVSPSGQEETRKDRTADEQSRPDEDIHEKPLDKILTFRLSREEYGLYMKDIQEITNYYTITPIPRSPDYLAGVISLRGKIVPILNLKKLFNIPDGDTEKMKKRERKVIILKAPDGPLGVVADMVLGTRSINSASLKDSPGNISEKDAKYIDSIAVIDNRFISILNAENLVSVEFIR